MSDPKPEDEVSTSDVPSVEPEAALPAQAAAVPTVNTKRLSIAKSLRAEKASDKVGQAYTEYQAGNLTAAKVLYEEALAVLEVLAEDYTLGALTNGNADIYKTDAGEYFDFAFLAEELGASKPAPDMFEAALSHADVSAAEIAHVGDNPDHDIEGARAVGMRTVWMNNRNLEWPGGQRADREITNLRQLPEVLASLG